MNDPVFYHISWLEMALNCFKESQKIKSINGNMTIDEFIKKYLEATKFVVKIK